MVPFKAPVEDILQSLHVFAKVSTLADWDDDLASDIVNHFAGFAENVISPLNASGDQEGAKLENGRVRMPVGFVDAYQQISDAGWQGLTAPECYGGMDASPLISAAVSEIFTGANHALQMVCNLVPGAITTILKFGTEGQKNQWIPRLASGEVLSTMCLTEPHAGSDLSGIRTSAKKIGSDWKITGEKIFISGGDQDMSASILHLVLARTGRKEDGVKGLSLFLCPAGAGVKVTRIEEKMGLHASPTCQMQFDAAEAELIGNEGEGLVAMFAMMNHARIDVALQGVAHAARALQISKAYADERRQGQSKDGAAATISVHADVRRMLDRQLDLAVTARAACHLTLAELERNYASPLIEFLTSLCKIYGSEAGIEAADLGIQILGGYGYLNEYGISQIWRDARITAIYEGTNGIHKRTLVTRGIKTKGAEAFADFVSNVAGGDAVIDHAMATWKELLSKIKNADDPLQYAHSFSEVSYALLRQAIWRKIGVENTYQDRTVMQRVADQILNSES